MFGLLRTVNFSFAGKHRKTAVYEAWVFWQRVHASERKTEKRRRFGGESRGFFGGIVLGWRPQNLTDTGLYRGDGYEGEKV